MPPFSPKTISETELQDLLLVEDSIDVNEDYLPLFQDLPPGFELLYNSPYSPTLDSPSTDNTFCSPNSSFDDMKQEIDTDIKNHLQIRILGVPNNGAKSRVETQIKLCIQLMTGNDKKVMDWSYIRIGENMLARSRLRKNQQLKSLDGSVATMVSDESKILQLEAKVVCASNTDHPIRMCVGCVRRERKRAERTKDGKQKNESITTDKELEYERDRILLFNCSPMINFSSGDAILPTRITCYCRHHNEKIGFRICFVMKNDKGITIASGISPPIMITDDHKSSKQKNNRKRSRQVEDTSFISRPNTPAASRRNSISTDDDSLDLIDTLSSSTITKQESPTDESIQCLNDNSNNNNNQDLLLYNHVFNNNNINNNNNLDEIWPFNRRRRTNMGYTSSDILDIIPQLDRLVPAQGPTYGGIEVTLLGSGFYQGLTCLFGEHQATTAYWNSSTMVCILPPNTQTGAVVVSFKEHPLVLDGQDVALFTYYDASDQALLELALQVVGLKSTGILQDAKLVAMGIVQGDEQYSQQPQQQQQQQQQQYQHVQQALINSLQEFTCNLDISITNENGHSLLHLAVIVQNEELVKSIIHSCLIEEKTKLFNLKDKNDMTALHFACQYKSIDIVRTLLHLGCNTSLVSTKDTSIQDLLDLYTHRKPLSRRPSVKSHMMHRFHSLSNSNEEKSDDQNTPSMESDGLGFVRQKIDRRLYLFWLPLLILAIGLLGVQMFSKQPKFLKPILDTLPNRHSISLSA